MLPVIASVPVECVFWIEDDGWKGACDKLDISVREDSFEAAKKKEMEAALVVHMQSILRACKTAA
jgi:hypothetical protein